MTEVQTQQHENKDVGGYNYTHPRGPIAAMYSSPGPCYGLPGLVGQKNHDSRSVHYKGPAWAFGIRHGKFRDDCSPGPAYFPDAKIYRDGKDGTPHYSLYSRQPDLNAFKPPGPGAYSPERSGPAAKAMPPAYSFGTRHKQRRTDQTPAANRYTLPGMLGSTVQSGKRQAPVISMRGRSKIGGFSEDLAHTPGPAKYNTVEPSIYKDRPPGYSMTSRNVMTGDNTTKPGPGAHSPENVYINKRQYPKVTFGMRHSQYMCPLIVDPTD